MLVCISLSLKISFDECIHRMLTLKKYEIYAWWKWPCEMFQNLPYFWNMKSQVVLENHYFSLMKSVVGKYGKRRFTWLFSQAEFFYFWRVCCYPFVAFYSLIKKKYDLYIQFDLLVSHKANYFWARHMEYIIGTTYSYHFYHIHTHMYKFFMGSKMPNLAL